MPRQIFVEPKPESEEEVKQSETLEKEDSHAEASKISFNLTDEGESMLVHSEELTKLFKEWDANGNNDLYINPSLAGRIEQYLEYQERMDPLKRRLTERMYAPYKCTVSKKNTTDCYFYINRESIGQMKVYQQGDQRRIITVSDLKRLLMAMNYPCAIWIQESDDLVDFWSMLTNNGAEIQSEYSFGTESIKVTTS